MPTDVSKFANPGTATTDAFGFETPAGALARVRNRAAQQRAQFFSSNASQRQGRRVGQALADIFGMPARRALDTATARREEVERLIQSGADEATARRTARETVKPEFAEVRKAKRMQELTTAGQSMVDDLIEQGVPGDRARAVGMLNVARSLEQAGFGTEATHIRTQASELMQAQVEREAALDNIQARTAGTRASTAETVTTLAADDDTFIKFDDDGVITSMVSLAVTDVEERESRREQGYINVGNAAFGINLDQETLRGMKPPSENVQENLIAGLSMLSGLRTLEGVQDQTGIIEGPLRGLASRLGMAKDGFIDAVAVADKMRADIQSLIKGIPSNYDAAVFEKLIPDPRKMESTELYNSRVRLLRDETTRMLELIVGFHKGTDRVIPDEVRAAARELGVDLDAVEPMNEQSFKDATAAHQRILQQTGVAAEIKNPTPDNQPSEAERQAILLERARNLRRGQ
jgi:hypothetical protein